MESLRTNPANGLYFHRGGTLIVYSILSLLFISMPIIGLLMGRYISRAASYDLELINAGYMDPNGRTLTIVSFELGRILHVLGAVILAFWVIAFVVALATA